MKTRYYLFFCLLLTLLATGAEKEILPAKISGHDESGTFYLYKNESRLGTIEYDLSASGDYTRKFTLTMSGQTIRYNLKIEADKEGYWKDMEIKTPAQTIEVTRKDGKASFTAKGKVYAVPLSDNHLIYESYGPVFESLMLKKYDHKKGGKQTFSRYLVPSKTIDMTLEYKGKEVRKVGKKTYTFYRFDANLLGIGLEIWADKEDKIYMMNVPVQYAAYVRKGYEEMLKFRHEDPLLSRPEYEVEKKTVMVAMRDGVKLATDLYFPRGKKGKHASILIRTPYKKEMSELEGKFYARRGYVVAIQDCRGRFGSQGTWEPFVHEEKDGYDAVEWLAAQKWSNKKVGMIGGSYVGWTQLWAAVAKPPHLTTIIPQVAPPDPFYNIPYEYGAFFIFGSIWWAEILETEATADLTQQKLGKINNRSYEKILKSLPVIDLDKKILGKKNHYWRKWIEHNKEDKYWAKANFMDRLQDVDIPVFLQSGWFDGDGIGSKLNYMRLKKSKNKHQKLILGPWGHTTQSHSRVGEHDFGPKAAPDLQTMYLKWFDYWLKGIDNKITEEPRVQLFVMFKNEWIKGQTYPLKKTKFTPLYLKSEKGANTSKGDGRLQWEKPTKKDSFDTYTYDPGDPTPAPQFYFEEEEEKKKKKNEKSIDLEKMKAKKLAFHRKITEKRKDILVYETEPLKKPVTIAGPLSAVLYASTSGKDTDWFVSLADVDEKGRIFPLVKGVIRARFRNSMKKPELVEPGRVYKYKIDMWQTAIEFQKGHRIRVEISSALFPLFSRNLNTGGHNEKETKYVEATQKIYHSKKYPSRVILPVVEMK